MQEFSYRPDTPAGYEVLPVQQFRSPSEIVIEPSGSVNAYCPRANIPANSQHETLPDGLLCLPEPV